jgi:surfeit locus 1 family protein
VTGAPARSTARGGLLWPTAAALAAFAILCALGTWQVQRLHWKEALIASVERGLHAAPVPAPGPDEWPSLDYGDREYQRVTVSGHFDESAEAYVTYTLTEPKGRHGGIGFLVMTPFTTPAGWTVYVNRGFVPRASRYPNQRPGGSIAGETTVTGLFRAPHDAPWWLSDSVSDNAWFSRDPMLYAKAHGLPPAGVAPYIVDADYDPSLPGGLPQGGETVVAFPNNHLGYAITWFGLAAALAGVYVALIWRRVRERRGGPPVQA